MPLNQTLLPELEQEGASTRKILALVPFTNPDWKPHEKSMTMLRLATHIAELPGWISMTINTTELDFAKSEYKPFVAASNEELLKMYDESLAKAMEDLGNASDATLMENWTMRNGDTVYFTMPKMAVLRTWCFNHLVHHRAQLGVYLRLNNILLPSIYGPTADEQ